jgi:hypothetical protein
MNKERIPKKVLNITKRNILVKRKLSNRKTNIIMETKGYERCQSEGRKNKARTDEKDH